MQNRIGILENVKQKSLVSKKYLITYQSNNSSANAVKLNLQNIFQV